MSPRNRKPQWWQLYVGLPVLLLLFLPETNAKLTEPEHVVAELGILALVFGFVQMWLRANRSALMQLGEEQGRWRVNLYVLPAPELRELEEPVHRLAEDSVVGSSSPETKGLPSGILGWRVTGYEEIVTAHHDLSGKDE